MGTGLTPLGGDIVEVPGIGQEFGLSMAQLGKGIAGLIDPYLEFHQRMREAMAANPKLMTNFADFASQNPEAFQKISHLLPKEVREAVAKTQPSLEATREAVLRPAVKRIGEMPEEQFPEHPTVAELGAYRLTAGGEPGQAETRRLQGRLAADATSFYSKLPTAEREHLAALGGISGERWVEDMAMRQQLLDEQKADRISLRADNLRLSAAVRKAAETGVGTEVDWDKLLFDPKVQKRARDLATGKIPVVSEDDQKWVEMYHAWRLPYQQRGSLMHRQAVAERSIHIRTMEGLIDRIEGTSRTPPAEEDQAKMLLPALQNEVDLIYGPGKFKVGPKERRMTIPMTGVHIPLKHGGRLGVTDAKGNDVPLDAIREPPADVGGVNPLLVHALLSGNPKAQAIWDGIVQTGDIEGGMQALHDKEEAAGTPMASSVWMEILRAARSPGTTESR